MTLRFAGPLSGAMLPWACACVALLVDRWLGEPPVRWHPVVWAGRYLDAVGRRFAPVGLQPTGHADWRSFIYGALAWSGGAALVTVLAWALQSMLLRLPVVVAAVGIGLVFKPLLAWTMLRSEVRAVESALADSLDAGRKRLSRLVSRDVSSLDEIAVRESAIESLAENLNDSVVAPLFWFAVAGLPGAALYRFANTADAMWGYRGLRGDRDWSWAGKWAARADDVLSFLPARLTALLLALVAPGMPVRLLRVEAARTPSPNGGWPMAAMALALGVRLSKPGVYALYARGRAPGSGDTARACVLAERAVLVLPALYGLGLLGIFALKGLAHA